ncbi:MAG TPA: transcriptional regulator, partial [Caulobacteraceae bacterium]
MPDTASSGSVFRFDRFVLDTGARTLKRDGARVDLNARYFDALVLLVREAGGLVTKTRFMDEVWRGVPVTDEALTQCVRTLRRSLGDDAARPRFIETAPKHGYRFVAAVERAGEPEPAPSAGPAAQPGRSEAFFRLGRAGMLGGGVAGLLGGLFYGSVAVGEGGAMSALLVVASVTVVLGMLGGGGVGFGVAAAVFAPGRRGAGRVLGGAAGGMIVGAVVKLVGLDAFDLLFGRTPGPITGAGEGLLLGAAAGLGAWIAWREPAIRPA